MNSVNLIGRLTADPDLRNAKNDTTVGSLRLAIQRPRKDGEDQGAEFVDVTVFGRQAEICKQYLAKGRKIGVEGTVAPPRMGGRERSPAEARSDRREHRIPRRPKARRAAGGSRG